jgi:hypothetical protein
MEDCTTSQGRREFAGLGVFSFKLRFNILARILRKRRFPRWWLEGGSRKHVS